MQAFRDALTHCSLEDLGFSGDILTWKHGRIRERLDRVVADGPWTIMHPGAMVKHLDYTNSDHRPILLDTEFVPVTNLNRTSRRKFEAKWLQEEGFSQVVHQAWKAAGHATSGGVLPKLEHMHASLHAWDKTVLNKPQ